MPGKTEQIMKQKGFIADYEMLAKQLKGLIKTEPYFVSVLSNASALLWEALDEINWAGFYIVKNGRLVLAPFQGRVACIHIEKGRGVCGTAWEKDQIMLVDDVHEFPGHIACDPASRSEIVIPIHHEGMVVGVLDIDSPISSRFSENDREGLLRFVNVIEDQVEW